MAYLHSFRAHFTYHKDNFCILAGVEKNAKIIFTRPPVPEINPANFTTYKLNTMVYNEIYTPINLNIYENMNIYICILKYT